MKKATTILIMIAAFCTLYSSKSQCMEANIGDKFGRLTITKLFKVKKPTQRGNYRMAVCTCDCGTIKNTYVGNLLNGSAKSCGCYSQERKTNHGFGKHKLFKVWSQMRARCQNPNNLQFYCYGARGISVCREWDEDAGEFIRWSLANGYKPGLTIDRRDVNGNYEPSNCRYITTTAQLQNTTRNIIVTIDGVTKCLAEWARFYGMCRYDLRRKYIKSGYKLANVLINKNI